MQLVNFLAAIDRLGTTEAERAKKLGISERSLRYWKNRALPRLIRTIAENEELAAALAADAQTKPEPRALAS